MKILFIITQSEMGGAQRYLLEFTHYLNKKGYEVVVAAGEGDRELFSRIESRTYHIPSLVRNLNPFKDLIALFAILKIIKKERPDTIFLQSTKTGFLGSLAAKLYQIRDIKYAIRIVYRIGGWSFRDPRIWWMNKILFTMEKISAPWKDVIIVNSEFDKNLAIKKKIAPTEKIIKIYNGINLEKLTFLSKEIAREKLIRNTYLADRMTKYEIRNTKIIGTIANLYATKGIEYLIETARESQATFVVIGEGKERPKLEALIKKHNLQDRFFLIGRKKNAYQYLKAFDVFVLPSVKEGFPWVLLEAMAAKIPIIATEVGAVPEIIKNEREGILVSPRNNSKLTAAIEKLLHDENFSNTLSRNAFAKLSQFSSKKMLEESEKIVNAKFKISNVK